MKTREELQADINALNAKIEGIDTRVLALHSDIQAQRTKAAAEFFEGREVRIVSEEIISAESELSRIGKGRLILERELKEALKELDAYNETDKQARVRELRKQAREAADKLQAELRVALESARSYEGLLDELRRVQQAPETFRFAGPPPMIIERMVNEALLYLDQSRPKNGNDENVKYLQSISAMHRTLVDTY